MCVYVFLWCIDRNNIIEKNLYLSRHVRKQTKEKSISTKINRKNLEFINSSYVVKRGKKAGRANWGSVKKVL